MRVARRRSRSRAPGARRRRRRAAGSRARRPRSTDRCRTGSRAPWGPPRRGRPGWRTRLSAPGLDPAHVQQVAHERRRGGRSPPRSSRGTPRSPRSVHAHVVLPEAAHRGLDRGERRPQVVGHGREDRGAQLVHLAQLGGLVHLAREVRPRTATDSCAANADQHPARFGRQPSAAEHEDRVVAELESVSSDPSAGVAGGSASRGRLDRSTRPRARRSTDTDVRARRWFAGAPRVRAAGRPRPRAIRPVARAPRPRRGLAGLRSAARAARSTSTLTTRHDGDEHEDREHVLRLRDRPRVDRRREVPVRSRSEAATRGDDGRPEPTERRDRDHDA